MTETDHSPRGSDLELLIRVAESYYLENRNQARIAADLGLSTATISRLLQRAREAGIVRIQVVRPQTRHGHLEAALCQALNLRSAVVAGPVSEDQRERHLGLTAAPAIDALIQPGAVLGLGRGRTLAALVEALQPYASPRQITVVQLLGEYGSQPAPDHTSEITRRMAGAYAGASHYLNAPAQVEDRATAEALRRAPGIREVLAVYERLDVALVGVGPLRGSPLAASQLLGPGPLAQLEAAGAVGEICGHYFDAAGRPVDDAYAGCVMGVSWEQLRRCPRVVAVAAGAHKVAAVRALAQASVIHHLATDAATAQALLA